MRSFKTLAYIYSLNKNKLQSTQMDEVEIIGKLPNNQYKVNAFYTSKLSDSQTFFAEKHSMEHGITQLKYRGFITNRKMNLT